MDIGDIADALVELGAEEDEEGQAFRLLQIKVGQAANHLMHIDSMDTESLSPMEKKNIEDVYRDMGAGLVVAAIDLMLEKGVDPERALEDRLDMMRRYQESAEKAMEKDALLDTELDPENDRSFH